MGDQLLMETIIINGTVWFSEPEHSFTTRAAFIKARPLTIHSVGTWSPYRHIAFYFASAPRGMNGQAWWAIDVDIERHTKPDAALLGTVEVEGSGFSWTGTYPTFVRSKRLYSVLAAADHGAYGVWGDPFGWFMGPLRGIPDSPD